MKSMKSLKEEFSRQSDIADLTPMLDCVFLLLLFFIVASSFSEDMTVFDIKLPFAANAVTKSIDEATELVIDAQGRFFLGETFVADENLFDELKKRIAQTHNSTLVIHGDKNCPYEKVVLAMDLAQVLEISDISMAVNGQK